MKPTSTFKMSKKTKALLSLMKYKNADYHYFWKQSMIEAELASTIRPTKDDKK